ncbi:MAG: hypothetical protein HYU66_25230 [Armatimonadetes bacterium]|nr:hypothetical protein [Armatimonadota bacterium]
MPTLQRGNAAHPLLGVYALRDGARWSVFVLSRKLGGRHDGADFGDGAAPVILHLPFQRAGKITLHKLTGDPGANNRQKLEVAIQDQDVPPAALRDGRLNLDANTGGVEGGMPEGSIFLYVIEAL